MRQSKQEPIKLSELPEEEQQYCSSAYGKVPHKFTDDYSHWAFDPGGRPVCDYCGVIDDLQNNVALKERKKKQKKESP